MLLLERKLGQQTGAISSMLLSSRLTIKIYFMNHVLTKLLSTFKLISVDRYKGILSKFQQTAKDFENLIILINLID